jgi:hypothetical protein
LYEAGQFSITINFNIPNSQLFQRGLFIRFGSSWKFGEITRIQDKIDKDGKGSQFRIITGYDARYILKRRVIKNMNSNGLWVMTGKGEIVLRNLINDQCGTNAENKRKLPITNTIPTSENAIGKEYSASEQFSNLYEVCKTIATQSEIGWRLEFNGTNLNLVCFNGTDRTQTVQFSTSFDSLANGEFIDSSESFSNAIYVGGKGQNDDRDIYEGESAIEGDSPSGLDRYESWDNQSSMTTQSEYETEALSMLNQYGQTLTMSGNGLAKCPYEYEKEYFVGDKIKIAFSGKSANAQILSVTEHWSWGNYEINFSFGKPLPDLNAQLQLILKQIQKASNKTNSTDSVRWYTIPTDSEMPKADVTYDTIGFIGNIGSGATFKLYLDDEKTGAKSYHVWFKQLSGNGKLTLTTGKSGAVNLTMGVGTYVAIISVDENGNIVNVASTPTDTISSGNNQPATSSGVAQVISDEANSRNTAISQAINTEVDNRNAAINNAINNLDANAVGGSGKYIESISENNGVISATEKSLGDMVPVDTVASGNSHSVTSNAVADAIGGYKKRFSILSSASEYTYYRISGLVGDMWLKDSTFLLESRGGESIFLAFSSDDSNVTFPIGFKLVEKYGKIIGLRYSTTTGFVYICLGMWANILSLTQLSGNYEGNIEITSCEASEYIDNTIEVPITTLTNSIGNMNFNAVTSHAVADALSHRGNVYNISTDNADRLILLGHTSYADSWQAFTLLELNGGCVDGWFGNALLSLKGQSDVVGKNPISMSNLSITVTQKDGELYVYLFIETFSSLTMKVMWGSHFNVDLQDVASMEGTTIWNNQWS